MKTKTEIIARNETMAKLDIGTKLRITDPDTVFTDGTVSVVSQQNQILTCKICDQPKTQKFIDYRNSGGKLFTLSSFIYVGKASQFKLIK
tara:strand:+ start:190 stop:459 length:270 start_codon:yes stop_codon:yes gene_type:complete